MAFGWRPPGSATTLGKEPVPLWGTTRVWDRIGLQPSPFPPGAFSQAHACQTARLHEAVREVISGVAGHRRGHLVDLFAGTGGVGLAAADLVASVTLVESFAVAARAA